MYHYSEDSPIWGKFFFLFYILLASFVMLNMFTLVVANQFEEFYFNPDNPITSFQDMAETFRKTWKFFTYRYNGMKIKEKALIEFFSCLASPLGYRYVEEDEDEDEMGLGADPQNVKTIIGRQEIAREIFKMDLTVDLDGTVPFGIVLHAALKNAYGKKFMDDIEKPAYKVIKQAEINCLADILVKTNKAVNIFFNSKIETENFEGCHIEGAREQNRQPVLVVAVCPDDGLLLEKVFFWV
jgi:hypothetical protein